jgi:thioredoxin reductase (NADPH)
MKTYDLLIIGSGPGGLSAALYAARYNMKVLILGELHGGTAATAHKICNYPGFEEITGPELMIKMINQVKKLNVEIKQEEVIDIKKENGFNIKTNKGEYSGKKIIIATGSQRMKLGLDREEEFKGKGISYCATCDANFYKNKTVAVVGGGNAALTAAILLAGIAKKVFIIYRQDNFFRAESEWIEKVKKDKKIEILFKTNVVQLKGENKLEKIKVDKNDKEIEIDGLFVEIGGISNLKLAKILGVELEGNFIKVDDKKRTNVKGVFAAGDVTNGPLKQIITACSDGAIAAFEAYKELIKEKKDHGKNKSR